MCVFPCLSAKALTIAKCYNWWSWGVNKETYCLNSFVYIWTFYYKIQKISTGQPTKLSIIQAKTWALVLLLNHQVVLMNIQGTTFFYSPSQPTSLNSGNLSNPGPPWFKLSCSHGGAISPQSAFEYARKNNPISKTFIKKWGVMENCQAQVRKA